MLPSVYQLCARCCEAFPSRRVLNEKFENRPSNNLLAKCGSKNAHIECNKSNCNLNNKADLDNTRKANLSYRIETENDLLGLTRPLSNCDSKKFLPCWAENPGEYANFIFKKSKCDKHKSIAQPLLCDRAITPTNIHKYEDWASYEKTS